MKSKVKNNNTIDCIEYPCLMASSVLVVLATSARSAMVVAILKEEDAWRKVGDYDSNFSLTAFKPFYGTVELSNN